MPISLCRHEYAYITYILLLYSVGVLRVNSGIYVKLENV